MLNTDNRTGEKETKHEKEQKEKFQTCIIKYFYHCQIPSALSLNHSILTVFSFLLPILSLCLSPQGYWRQLVAVWF